MIILAALPLFVAIITITTLIVEFKEIKKHVRLID
jgi:hypothetical protein